MPSDPNLVSPTDQHSREGNQNSSPAGRENVFIGQHGVRAGWSALLFLGILLVLNVALGYAVRPLARLLEHSSRAYMITGAGEAVLLLTCLLATAIMARIERRSMWSYGLRGPAPWSRFITAAAWGLAWLTVMLAGMDIFGHFSPGGVATHGESALWFAAFWLIVFFLVGMTEETLFRGYLQYTLARGMGFWPAAVLLACLFGFVHTGNSGENKLGAAAAGLFGLFLSFTLKRTGSLWWAIGFHTAWDYAESFIYSVPDSGQMVTGHLLSSRFSGPAWITGGTVGPEGSYFIFPLLGAMALLFALVYRKSELRKEDYAPTSAINPAVSLNAGELQLLYPPANQKSGITNQQ